MCGGAQACWHVCCGLVYICCGALQLVGGVFAIASLGLLRLGSNIWTGAWGVVVGIVVAMVACVGEATPRRQEALLYVAVSVLVANVVNLVLLELGEWHFFLPPDFQPPDAVARLLYYVRMTTSLSTVVSIFTSFVDSQFTFCSMQRRPKPRNVHEQVSDIEYIIPRKKSNSVAKQAQNIYSQYAQSWVFDTDTTSSKDDSPYLKLSNSSPYERNPTYTGERNSMAELNCSIDEKSVDHQQTFVVNPTVHIDQVLEDKNSDRTLNYMKSFSRTPSPVGASESSSQDSSSNPPIYECLERLTEPSVYRSRLNTALSLNEGTHDSLTNEIHSTPIRPRSETFTKDRLLAVDPTEKVQYASLMVELQQAFRSKKGKYVQPTSPQGVGETIIVQDFSSQKPVSESKSSSQPGSSQENSQKTEQKGSDAEFSKELEAALQLIQDLESPNTIETPSETCRSTGSADAMLPGGSVPVVCVKWRDSDDTESTKTLSECVSPTEENPDGKISSVVVVNSESSSGYSSPTPGNSTPHCPSVTGSSSNLTTDQVSFAIHNTGSAAIISLFSSPGNAGSMVLQKRKSVTTISGLEESRAKSPGISDVVYDPVARSKMKPGTSHSAQSRSDLMIPHNPRLSISSSDSTLVLDASPQSTLKASTSRWNVKSLLKKKTSPPVLTPELESAIFKSESLAYLTDLELLARHARNKSIQRQIEQKVQQQIFGHSSSESNC